MEHFFLFRQQILTSFSTRFKIKSFIKKKHLTPKTANFSVSIGKLCAAVVESQRRLTSVRSLLVLAALGERAVGAALFHFHHSSAGAAGKHKDMLV